MYEMTDLGGRSRHREPAATLDLGLADDVPLDPDPLDPHPEHPTPIEMVLRLTASERETRVKRLVEMAWNRYDQALDVEVAGRNVAGVCSLVSGGNDSYTVAHIFRSVATHHVHANTGTGIEATRQFVRETAAAWGITLLEEHAPTSYFDIVVNGHISPDTGKQVWPAGFPGPAAHHVMYTLLKERSLRRVAHHLGVSGSRTDRVVFIAGRRRPESKRRATVPHYESQGTIVWASPIAVWHKADLRAYRLMHPDVPANPVAQVLGMSGECGCLANAVAEEPQRWRDAYPDDPFIRKINETEALIADRTDIPQARKKWGWGGSEDDPDAAAAMTQFDGTVGALCSTNCGPDPIFDLMDPLFD